MNEEKKIITPRGNRLLVKLIPEKEISHGKLNLILPDQKDTYGMPHRGEIIAVGDGVDAQRMAWQPGDIVFFSKYNEGKNGVKIDVDGQECVLLNTSDIYGRPIASWREYVYTYKEVAQEPIARGLGVSGGDADSHEDAGKSEGVQESSGAEAGDVCGERSQVEA